MSSYFTPIRRGCNYCFKTLDSADADEKLKAIVECRSCAMLYHEYCWRKLEGCPKCGATAMRYVVLAPPPPPQPPPNLKQILPEAPSEMDSLIRQNQVPFALILGVAVTISLLALLMCLGVFAYSLTGR